MIRFDNDYNRGAMQCVLEALAEYNRTAFAGYGEDELCGKAADSIRKLCCTPNADVYFFSGATQTNFTVLGAGLSSVQSVIAADTGHISCHEAASVENTGHKILELPNREGKITADQIRECAEGYFLAGEPEYLTEPKAVYLSFPTEQGTLYSLKELREISSACKQYNMYLFVDGARMAYGLASSENDVTPEDFGTLADVFYLGGTKCGAMFGEALVISADSLKRRFKAYMKQNGAVLAKGWLLGLQFSAMLDSGEYLRAAKVADDEAMRIRRAFEEKKIPLFADSPTNQQFVILNDEQKEKLGRDFIFCETGKTADGTVVRFCTSWATDRKDVDYLISKIRSL